MWTHYLKSTEILDWKDPYYTGKAIRMGAGVQGYEAMAAAKAKGLVVLGGECPTVRSSLTIAFLCLNSDVLLQALY